MILRRIFFYMISLSFCSVVFFASGTAFAKQLKYAHALVITAAGTEIPVEVADTLQKKKFRFGETFRTEKRLGYAVCL